ncbi:histidinol-phosphatase [Skermanella sp. TT6]|uniref:Histidinol-phosphatase n=1 Tax=Skermanella cutis TaxID=2775420 RepID=A0ABX7B6L5_9PROT|nr:histidinol-phosphatase [Skermanella sp. TT6]QQP90026.1 histidinol-phosphatase [Skermanella sp. TT6]
MTDSNNTDQPVTPSGETVDLACRLADAAGTVIRRYFRTPFAVDDKPDSSPVTVADREAEAAIRSILAAERPDDGIVGEEHGTTNPDAEWLWVIDPIDGTKSFITGRPTFGTLVALLHRGVPVLGVIDQPIVGDRWIGVEGRPTTLNGKAARVRACPTLGRATLNTTSPDLFGQHDFTAFRRVADEVKLTMYGGDCYAYGLLAAGFVDLVIEAGLKLYDFAALVPVVQGAGGIMTDWTGAPLGPGSDGRVLAAGDIAGHTEALRRLGVMPFG